MVTGVQTCALPIFLIRFKVRGGFRPGTQTLTLGASGSVSIRFKVRGGFRQVIYRPNRSIMVFQSALRFAVVSDPTPWHAVLTSPVAAVLHTTPPHPLQQADRTCPKWSKTPSQVAYTPEAVFGRSPTTPVRGCLQNPRLRAAGIAGFFQPYPHAASRPVLSGVGGSGSGRILHITV